MYLDEKIELEHLHIFYVHPLIAFSIQYDPTMSCTGPALLYL